MNKKDPHNKMAMVGGIADPAIQKPRLHAAEFHYLNCINDQCEFFCCVARREHEVVVSALTEAVEVINGTQGKILGLTNGDNFLADRLREVWSQNASYLSKHYKLQNKFLDNLHKEAGAKCPTT